MATPASKEEPVTTSTLLSQSLDSLASLCSVYLQSLAKGGQCTQKQVKQSKLVISANDIHSFSARLRCWNVVTAKYAWNEIISWNPQVVYSNICYIRLAAAESRLALRSGSTIANEVQPRRGYC